MVAVSYRFFSDVLTLLKREIRRFLYGWYSWITEENYEANLFDIDCKSSEKKRVHFSQKKIFSRKMIDGKPRKKGK